jgi:phospholipid/cholesterol/gamma-HCH transport system substrate-binding protein
VTPARGVGLGVLALLLVVAVAAVLLLRGASDTEYVLRFQNAGQLVDDDDVQIGGRRVGAVQDITLGDNNEAVVRISVDDEFAPLHEGTTAAIRLTSLSGIANRYVALSPGPNSARELEAGSTLTADRTTTPVDLDQLFSTFDPATRRNLQKVIRGSATASRGVGKEANEALRYLNPAVTSTSRLVGELAGDQRAFQDLLVETSRVVSALAERRGELSSAVGTSNEAFAAIAAEEEALRSGLDRLGPTLRRANSTFVNLRATLGDLDELTDVSLPATRELAPFLRELRPLVRDAGPTVSDLRRLVRSPGGGNDLTELLRQAPGLERTARPALRNASAALERSTPVLDFIRPYTPDLVGWLRGFGQSTANYDANGHYARVQPMFNAFLLGEDNVLRPNTSGDRLAGAQTGVLRRCPGAATPPAADGSNPWRDVEGDLDCDPADTVPGP